MFSYGLEIKPIKPILSWFDWKQEPSDQSCRIGTTIVLEGNIRQLNRAANDGNYDEFQYYHSLNMDYHFDAERICGEYGREDVLAEKLFTIKEKLKRRLYKLFIGKKCWDSWNNAFRR